MAGILTVLNRLKAVDLDTAIPAIIQQTSFEITTLNQLQLQKGLASDGNKIKPDYKSNSYAKKKSTLNPEPGFGTPDLNLTGALYQGMGVVLINNDKFEIRTSVLYGAKLEAYYKTNGSDVLKLTDASKGIYAKGAFWQGLKKYLSATTQLL